MLKRAVLVLFSLIAAVPLWAAPDEQIALRYVGNFSRLALGCDPLTADPEGADWVLRKPTTNELTGGTPNQKMLVRVWHYGWALRTGSSELASARTTLLDFINRQQQAAGAPGSPLGHYATDLNANEELTSSHYQLWSASLAAAYLYAIANGGTLNANSANTTPETLVRDAARKWWSDEKVLYDKIHTNGKIDAPGARFGANAAHATNPLRDDIYLLLKGQAPVKVRTCTSDKYYTSSFVLQALRNIGIPALGQAPAGWTPSAKQMDTLCVYRNGSNWTLYFPTMRGVSDPVFWVQLIGTTRTDSQLNPGKPLAFPAGSFL
ncbi:MAG TPA: hypothetical protein VGD79_11725, partial [Thermoanaerobaculia bacterium]